MSHPKTVEVAKFYKDTGRKFSDYSAPSYPSFTKTRCFPGDIGFTSTLSSELRSKSTSPSKVHHLKYGIGLAASHIQRQHMFTDLPGQTFNAVTWQHYTTNNTAPRAEFQAHSPLRKKGS